MYKIIASNGAEYGPVTLEQLRQWIAEGRVNAQTQAQLQGETGWRPMGSFPELAALLPAAAAPVQPPFAAPTPFGAGAQNPAAEAFARDEINAPAIGLLVAGVLGAVYCVYQLIANITGANARVMEKLKSMPGQDPQALEMMQKIMDSWQYVIFFQLIAMGFIIFGAIKMRKLENFALCVCACVVAVVPCITSPCCCLGVPIGIWALIVMNRPEVRIHFK